MALTLNSILVAPRRRSQRSPRTGTPDTTAKLSDDILSVSPVVISPEGPFTIGQSILFAFLVHNGSTRSRVPTVLSLVIDKVPIWKNKSVSIDPGKIDSFRFSHAFEKAGKYIVCGCADASNGTSRIVIVQPHCH